MSPRQPDHVAGGVTGAGARSPPGGVGESVPRTSVSGAVSCDRVSGVVGSSVVYRGSAVYECASETAKNSNINEANVANIKTAECADIGLRLSPPQETA